MIDETKNQRFKRLAQQRGNRILKDIRLLGNLSNKNNYIYTEQEISKLFGALEQELRSTKGHFITSDKREDIKL